LELPTPLSSTALLFQLPSYLFIEHRDALACVVGKKCAELPWVAGLVSRHTSTQISIMGLHTLEKAVDLKQLALMTLPRLLPRCTLLLVVVCVTSILSQLLLNGHKVLARIQAAGQQASSSQQHVTNSVEQFNGNACNGIAVTPWEATMDRWTCWTHESATLCRLYQPLAMPVAAITAEIAFMKAALSMKATHLLVPALCTPVVAYSYLT
jgi:hypothetical protein